MRNARICLLLLTLTLLVGITSSRIYAQEEAEIVVDEEIEVQEPTVQTRPPQTERINQLRQEYRGYLEKYRADDREYQIANEQYLQLGTLVSLETAVRATRQAMLSRNQVLVTYLTILQIQLEDATGVSLENKERVLTRLEAMIAELTAFETQIEVAQDRGQVTNVAADFTVLSPQIEDVAYQAQTLLAASRLQAVFDTATSLGEEVYQATSDSGGLRQAERDRAYAEIRSNLTQSRVAIDEANTLVARENASFSRTGFSRTLRDLGSSYAGLSQTLAYIQELLRL